jgi:hypothetical protein
VNLNLQGFLGNLVPVTIGNIFGGGFMVAAVYWFIYRRRREMRGRFGVRQVLELFLASPAAAVEKSDQSTVQIETYSE